MERTMAIRLITYLAFLWVNVTLGWSILHGNIFYRGWLLALLGIMTTLSLVSLTTTDPGRIRSTEPDHVCPSSRHSAQQQQYFTQFCSICNNIKPERAHHCRICKRCVLKMDHHCHWVGRCVGAGNYKSYILTLFYALVSSGVMLYVLWGRSGKHESSLEWMRVMKMLGLILNWLLLVSIFCAVSYLLIWHGYLVSSNVTTIEYFKWKRSMRDPGQYALSPGTSIRLTDYDRGLLSNLREALGHNIFLWFWPGFGEGWKERCCGEARGVLVAREAEAEGESSNAGVWWAGAAEAKKAFFFPRYYASRSGSAAISAAAMEEGDGDEGRGPRASALEMTGRGSRAPPPTLPNPL